MSHATVLTNLLLPAVRLHLLPKLSVDVYLHVLEADSDEAVLGAGLSAACAAIADAGIELNGLAVGSTVVSTLLFPLIPGPARLVPPPRPHRRRGSSILGSRDCRLPPCPREDHQPPHGRRGRAGPSVRGESPMSRLTPDGRACAPGSKGETRRHCPSTDPGGIRD